MPQDATPQLLLELMAQKAGFPATLDQEDDGSGFVVYLIHTPHGTVEVSVQTEFTGPAAPQVSDSERTTYASPGERTALTNWASAPAPPVGPGAYCARCAASGCGVCDDYPKCPAGRAQEEKVLKAFQEDREMPVYPDGDDEQDPLGIVGYEPGEEPWRTDPGPHPVRNP